MRILIAEDEKDLNVLLKKRLENQKYSVDACCDGEEALDYLAVTEYDAVVLDIMMPKINGLQVLQKIRKEGTSTPVLLLTAKDSIEDRVTGLDLGADSGDAEKVSGGGDKHECRKNCEPHSGFEYAQGIPG